MVNKKCERDVWSSGKNGENNAEKEQSRRSRRGRRAFRTRQLYRTFTLRPPEKARQHRRGRGGHLQLGRRLGVGRPYSGNNASSRFRMAIGHAKTFSTPPKGAFVLEDLLEKIKMYILSTKKRKQVSPMVRK